MCNYHWISKRTVENLHFPWTQLHQYLGDAAHRTLTTLVRRGRVAPGVDFRTGKRLGHDSIRRGHYLRPSSFRRYLKQLETRPHICGWCGHVLGHHRQRLQKSPTEEHLQGWHHDGYRHRCWVARNLCLAVCFGIIQTSDLLPRNRKRRKRPNAVLDRVVNPCRQLVQLRVVGFPHSLTNGNGRGPRNGRSR